MPEDMAGRLQAISLHDVDAYRRVNHYADDEGGVSALALDPGGRRLAASTGDHSLEIYDMATAQCQAVLNGHTKTVWGLAWLTSHRLISASEDCLLRVWDVDAQRCIATWKTSAPALSCAAAGNRIAVSLKDGSIYVLEVTCSVTAAASSPGSRCPA